MAAISSAVPALPIGMWASTCAFFAGASTQARLVGGIVALHDYARSSMFLKERAERRPARGPLEVREAVDEWLLSETQRADTQVRPYWEDLGITDSIKALRRVRQ